ncbi:MAG: Rieske 2Fe-2S domain-containing protein [Verrucomicrobia bacterium]|nr:Rieske 2Fe-2S domain-containing protein [Verrucomicrobiota bacterium]
MCAAHNPENSDKPTRRNFFKEGLCIAIGTTISIVPFAAGLAVYLDPLRKKTAAPGDPIRVASLTSLPEDGIPRKFAVLADRSDAWNKYPNVPVGAVYLRRREGKIEALHSVCPHAGCFIDYAPERNSFLCPCHNSTFALDGSINDPKSPSPRGMDPLEVEIRGNDVYVDFKNFRAGIHDRIPEA